MPRPTERSTVRAGRSATPRRPVSPAVPVLLLAALLPAPPVAAAPAGVQDGGSPAAASVPAGGSAPRQAATSGRDLRRFLVRVLDRSPEAEAASLRREAAGHTADARRSPPNPTLEAEGPDSEGVAQLQLRQPLRIFGQGEALRRLERAERSLAARRLTAEHASLAREAARAWVEAAADRREVALLGRELRLRRDALGRGRAALARGRGRRERVHELRLEARAAERELAAARAAARRSREELGRLLGRPAGELPEPAAALAGDPGRDRLVPFPGELPPGAPASALARAGTSVAAAELARSRTRTRPVPAVGPMVSLGKGVDPGLSLELSLPLWNRNRDGIRAARARLEASEAAGRATRRAARAAYGRLVDRRSGLADRLGRLRSRELRPARREVRRWEESAELGLPVADGRRRARARVLGLEREELGLQRRLALLDVEAAARSGALLRWLRDPGPSSGGSGR